MNVVHIRHQQTTYSQQYHQWTCLPISMCCTSRYCLFMANSLDQSNYLEKWASYDTIIHPFIYSSKHETVKNNTWLIFKQQCCDAFMWKHPIPLMTQILTSTLTFFLFASKVGNCILQNKLKKSTEYIILLVKT